MDKSVRHVLPRQVMSKVTEFVRTAQNIVDVNKSFEPPQSDGSDQVNVVGDKEDCYPSNDCNCVECSSQNLLSNSETTRRMSGDFSDVYDVSRLFSAAFEKSYKAGKRDKRRARHTKCRADSDSNWRDKEKSFKQAPNYFVSIKISNKQIVDSMKRIQESLMLVHPQLEQVMVPVATIHLTLMVMRLDTADHIQRAKLALENSGSKIRELYKQLISIQLSGVGSFGGSVLFAKLANHDDMKCVAEIVAEKFMEQSIVSTDGKSKVFKPHITILKFSKLYKKRQPKKTEKLEIRKVTKDMYSEFETMEFGSDIVTGIQLCSMMKPKDLAGYYFVEHEVSLNSNPDSH